MSESSKAKSLVFGISQYEAPFGRGDRTSVQAIRSFFLTSVTQMVPRVGDELEQLLPLYKKIPLFCYSADPLRRTKADEASRLGWHMLNRPSWTSIEKTWRAKSANTPFLFEFPDYYTSVSEEGIVTAPQPAPVHNDQNIGDFVEELFDWSKNDHLDAQWCREHAYETLDLWANNEVYRKAGVWGYGPTVQLPNGVIPLTPVKVESREFTFRHTTYYPYIGFRKEIRKQILADCGLQLDKFLSSVEADAEKHRALPMLRKDDDKHFVWLIDYQINRMSYESLYKRDCPDQYEDIMGDKYFTDEVKRQQLAPLLKTISNAVRELARTMQLPLRKSDSL